MAAEAYAPSALYEVAEATPVIKKFCALCRAEKDIQEFAPDRRSKDGHRWHCSAHQNPGPRPKMRYCAMCQCKREVFLFPVEKHDHHPAGREQRRWYCVIGQEAVPEEVGDLEQQKREMHQLQHEINVTADERQKLLLSAQQRTPEFVGLLMMLKNKLDTLWKRLREVKARALADASELQLLVCGRYGADSEAMYGPALRNSAWAA